MPNVLLVPRRKSVVRKRRTRVILVRVLLLVAAALAVTTYAFYRRDLGAAKRDAALGSTMVDTPCGPIEYASVGEGTPVLALHGTGGGWDQGIQINRGLVAHGFRLIAPSRYGYLRTAMPENASPQKEADGVVCLLDALGITRVAVTGASAGAAPALQFALRHPERASALVLLVPAAGGIVAPAPAGPPAFVMKVVLRYDFPFWLAMRIAPRVMLRVVAVPTALLPSLSADDRNRLDQTIRMILPVSSRRNGIMYDANFQASGAVFPIERITTPTLLISAADDLYRTLPNAQRAATRMPNARLLAFETGGHLLLGHDHEIGSVVAEFIRGR